MTHTQAANWLSEIAASARSHRRMIDAILQQLSDDELVSKPVHGINSIAVLLRHLGGNLQSRWTDFLISDGEKPDRDREREFQDWVGDRESLMKHFNRGWQTFESAMASINESNLETTLFIRGETHSIAQALLRSLTHIAYHVGQMAMIARMVHHGDWRWLTIPPGASDSHNERTWGTGASRSIYSEVPAQPDESKKAE